MNINNYFSSFQKLLLKPVEKDIVIPYLIYTSHLIYLIVYLKLFSINTYYTTILELFIQLYIAVFLLYYFNPFASSNVKITKNIKKAIFSAGLVLFTNNIGIFIRYLRENITTINKFVSYY